MAVRMDRIKRAQELMIANGIDGLMILTHDDFIYFFADDRFQPRAFIPRQGEPTIIAFRGEADEIKEHHGIKDVRVFASMGQQISDVVGIMKEQMATTGQEKLTIGVQLGWFAVPASLFTIFQNANPRLSLVDSGPVMDPLRAIKDEGELALMQKAAELAETGMNAVQQTLRPGVREYEVAAEAEYAIRKLGGQFPTVPVYVNSGHRSRWLHGTTTERVIQQGDLVVVDLVPFFGGYCVNLTRTFVIGEPTEEQQRLAEAYLTGQKAAKQTVRPGRSMREIDKAVKEALKPYDYAEHFINGFSHSLGLRFEEDPAPTIHPTHASHKLQAGMTITAGHSVLVDPNVGGMRMEDTGLVTDDGWQPITKWPEGLIVV